MKTAAFTIKEWLEVVWGPQPTIPWLSLANILKRHFKAQSTSSSSNKEVLKLGMHFLPSFQQAKANLEEKEETGTQKLLTKYLCLLQC